MTKQGLITNIGTIASGSSVSGSSQSSWLLIEL
jgi:hypothetical protein